MSKPIKYQWAPGEFPVGTNYTENNTFKNDPKKYESLTEKIAKEFILHENGLIYSDKSSLPIGYLNESLGWLWNTHIMEKNIPKFEKEHKRLTEIYLTEYVPYKDVFG